MLASPMDDVREGTTLDKNLGAPDKSLDTPIPGIIIPSV